MNNYKNIEPLNHTNTELNDETKKYCFKDELERVFYYYKNKPETFYTIIISFFTIYYLVNINNVSNINNNKSYNKKFKIQHGGENGWRDSVSAFTDIILNKTLWKKLSTEFPLNTVTNWIKVVFSYIFLAFIVRPVKSFAFIILILLAIAGSFIFPFIVIGIMVYFVYKKILLNKKPNF
jgi:magnesium-transporting ATPase (P-type)